ncbi:prolyl 4-hydroxylase subunit alpha-3-like isoform X1 [Branchiostoma lanceolatum]|uniref:prolyl 4-hydroxylase subunit alpha-3-like isoform X1 n=1 Tax=Branchiostoma lanceolatum TaxID=7740 RepID=UPI0034549024
MDPSFRVVFYVLFLTMFYSVTDAGFFSAVARLGKLVQEEREIVAAVKQHVQNGGKVSADMKRYVDSFDDNNTVPEPDYIAHHPVRAYFLIKRLSKITLSETKKLTGKEVQLPTVEDLHMTALALIVLQDVYGLDMRSLVQGQLVMVSQSTNGAEPQITEICGKDPTFTLDPSDTYYIGEVACKENKFYQAVLWFNLTLEMMREKEKSLLKIGDEQTDRPGPRMRDVLLKLADTVQKIKWDRDVFMAVSQLGATKANAEGLSHLSNLLENAVSSLRKPIRTEIPHINYENLCRLGVLKNQAPHPTLTCRYVRPTPYFYLSPAKMELLHERSPLVALYHDVITDKEVNKMRDIAFRRMGRSPVVADDGGEMFSRSRVSETGWIFDTEHPMIAKLSRRVGYITGLDVNLPYGEAFQVLNYGLGGFYEPHVDYFRDEQPVLLTNGQRIATFLFYLSDVEAGGATVFTRLNLTVPAVKNSAVLFHDLKKSLAFEQDSEHAGCPVLMGSKWIANKWIHTHGNEFRWPCGLTPEE